MSVYPAGSFLKILPPFHGLIPVQRDPVGHHQRPARGAPVPACQRLLQPTVDGREVLPHKEVLQKPLGQLQRVAAIKGENLFRLLVDLEGGVKGAEAVLNRVRTLILAGLPIQ